MRVFVDSYGCTFNQADGRIIRAVLEAAGFTLTSFAAADAVVLNTCAVKNATESRMFSKIEKYLSARKKVVVAGCLPRISPQRLRCLPVSVVDSESLERLPQALSSAGPAEFCSDKRLDRLRLLAGAEGNGQPVIVPIASGCLSHCAYCAVKNARGGLASHPPEQIEAFIRNSAAHGSRLFFLTSQDNGCYGMDIGTNLAELLNKIVAVEGDFQVRVGMMNPERVLPILDGLVSAFKSPKVVKFVHVPVQSGSDKVLREMNRHYTAEDFEKIVAEFKKAIPDTYISTDIIVGFPTETGGDFEQTLRFVERIRPDKVNISKYYVRPNSPAASLKPLPTQVLKERSCRLSVLCSRSGRQ